MIAWERRRRWLAAVLISISSAALPGCQHPLVSWGSPEMAAIEREWTTLDRPFQTQSPDEFAKHCKELDAILRKHLSWRDMWHLADTAGSLPARATDRNDFVNVVLKFMTETYLDGGNREGLLTLLETRFPDQIYFEEPIEFAVARHTRAGSVLIFGEAYSRSRDETARHHLAIVVRRAFLGSGIEGKDDAEFIRNAMRWYENNRDHLVVNPNCYYLKSSYDDSAEVYDADPKVRDPRRDASGFWAAIKRRPLFVEKASVPAER
jgi:hypothetical protein